MTSSAISLRKSVTLCRTLLSLAFDMQRMSQSRSSSHPSHKNEGPVSNYNVKEIHMSLIENVKRQEYEHTTKYFFGKNKN